MFLVTGLDDGAPDPASTNERHDEYISDLCAFVERNSFLVEEGTKGECCYHLCHGGDKRGESTSSYAKV